MAEFRTLYESCKSRGVEYDHPLGKIAVVGSLVESFPPGSYMSLVTHCPTINAGPGSHVALGWYIAEGFPPRAGSQVPWLCGCVRAEKVVADVSRSLIVRDSGPAILDGARGLIWYDSFETISMEDYLNSQAELLEIPEP